MSRYSSNRSSLLLSDNSWIRKDDDEDEDIDRDPNFAKTVLSQRSETTLGPDGEEIKTTTTTTKRSVHDLTKRFSGSHEELIRSSTLPSSKTSSYTRSYSSLKSDSPSSTRTTTVSKDGTTTETTFTTTQSLKSPVLKSPPLTETFSERVRSSSRGSQYTSYSPSRTTQVTEAVTSGQDAVDNLYDTLLPSAIRGDYSTADRKTTVSTTETVIVKSTSDTEAEEKLYTLTALSPKSDYSPTDSSTTTVSQIKNGIKTTTTTRTSSTAEDDLYGTLLPRAITSVSNQSSPVSSSITKREIITVESSRGGESPTLSSPSSTRRTSSYSSYTDELPSSRTTSYTISTMPSEEYSSDRRSYSYSKTDSRPLLEKDLCTYCRRPFTGDAKMVLEDMKINCHASCFKCEVCNSTLGHMKAGDSMWIYKRMVHCENCFEVTRDKWRC